ncbi:CatB-related O-acetyltransferase [Arthrobacter sp. M4]|uniref:CatB-related O-acetyltransferase n=1 Tax=Arthrobacter sp. M4 TaxID=218160 RepID=UPI001CDBD271|nr:CatB-related O-acetyltransferase [Arthrobacter sp. M4]MCA4133060.1 CatB-related O-acetyltransferase [Arthrobacter sp. M4]
MRQSTVGKIFAMHYLRVPFRQRVLNKVVSLEGGDMYSATLREILEKYHGIKVGDFSYGSLLNLGYCDPQTVIGDYVSIGPNVRRFGASHPLGFPALHPLFYNPGLGLVAAHQDVERSQCWIGHDSWIGANVTILPGCTRIGIGAVIGAGSVVTRDVPDFAVVAGNPAKVLKIRFTDEKQAEILASEFWTLNPSDAFRTVTLIGSRMEKSDHEN